MQTLIKNVSNNSKAGQWSLNPLRCARCKKRRRSPWCRVVRPGKNPNPYGARLDQSRCLMGRARPTCSAGGRGPRARASAEVDRDGESTVAGAEGEICALGRSLWWDGCRPACTRSDGHGMPFSGRDSPSGASLCAFTACVGHSLLAQNGGAPCEHLWHGEGSSELPLLL